MGPMKASGWNVKACPSSGNIVLDIINARKGILRNNGNILLVGRLKNASNKYGFIEVDPGNGNPL